MHELRLCQICKNIMCNNNTCENCHNLYWEFSHLLPPEKNNELQIVLRDRQPLPIWFEAWWNKIKSLTVFL